MTYVDQLGSGPMNEFENHLRVCPQSHRLWIERGLAVGRVLRALSLKLKAKFHGGLKTGERNRPNPKDNALRDQAALHG